jgi:DNA-binding protein HU-beta
MNKSDLIDAIASHANLTKADAGWQLDGINQSISSALKSGDLLALVGFPRRNVGQRCAYAQHDTF